MTYLAFHLVFILPPLVVLAATLPRPWAGSLGVGGRRARWTLPLIAGIAFAYTTPWDNYLVYRGIWSYGADRVLAIIGYVPLEEYLFFLLQPFLTGFFAYHMLARFPPEAKDAAPSRHRAARWIGTSLFLLLTLLGAGLLAYGPERALYLGLILAWAAPVLASLWCYGADVLWAGRRAFFLSVAVPTLYLWIADACAIALGIWDIAADTSLGIRPLGLPVEEAVFFLATNLLVVEGVFVFLFGDRIARLLGKGERVNE